MYIYTFIYTVHTHMQRSLKINSMSNFWRYHKNKWFVSMYLSIRPHVWLFFFLPNENIYFHGYIKRCDHSLIYDLYILSNELFMITKIAWKNRFLNCFLRCWFTTKVYVFCTVLALQLQVYFLPFFFSLEKVWGIFILFYCQYKYIDFSNILQGTHILKFLRLH